ncbi:MAG: hypothetical protein WDZ41_00325 [Candidatus Babeliales bacterium]
MLDHCTYDKVKLLHELSCIVWFIEKHAKIDAKNDGDTEFANIVKKLAPDLEKYIDQLYELL